MIRELEIFCQMETLTGNGSQKEKQRLIFENLSEEMTYILDVCFNPFVTTKLHKLEFDESQPSRLYASDPGAFWASFHLLIEDLKSAPAANDLLRGRAHDLLNHSFGLSPERDIEMRKMLMKIFTKRMNIGIGAKLINKAIERELIPDPSVMLATDDQKEIEKWDKIYCEEKYDGVRVIAIINDSGDFSFYTRAFNELDSSKLQNITSELKKAAGNLRGIFFDGELTDHNRKSVSGKVTQILKGTAPENIDESFLFNVFDVVPSEVLNTGRGSVAYTERRKLLSVLLEGLKDGSCVRLGQMWEVNSMEEILAIYKEIVDLGGEGVICKSDHFYECKRSKSWVKLKEVTDCDLVITGWYPGEGKREGFIGGLVCTDASGTLNVKIGSGFTDKDLSELSKDPDSLIGKIAAVQYNVTITDKHNNRSLFLPRFIEVRSDKDTSDDLSKMF